MGAAGAPAGPGPARDFFWSAQAEPHARRRREILGKYGDQVRALYGYDASTAVQVRRGPPPPRAPPRHPPPPPSPAPSRRSSGGACGGRGGGGGGRRLGRGGQSRFDRCPGEKGGGRRGEGASGGRPPRLERHVELAKLAGAGQ